MLSGWERAIAAKFLEVLKGSTFNPLYADVECTRHGNISVNDE